MRKEEFQKIAFQTMTEGIQKEAIAPLVAPLVGATVGRMAATRAAGSALGKKALSRIPSGLKKSKIGKGTANLAAEGVGATVASKATSQPNTGPKPKSNPGILKPSSSN